LWLLLVEVMGLNPRDPEYKRKLPSPKDPYLWAFWQKQMAGYSVKEKGEVISSSLNKLGRFLGNPVVRNIVAQPESGFSLPDIMDNGKILFCNMAKGVLGEDNSSLLGSVLINMVLIAALSRRNQDPAKRKPVHLVVDEYQTFATESFPILQSEARKYGITITVAHQYRDQLDDLNKGSTMNCANFICLRVSGRDAEELATQFDNTPEEPDTRLEAVPQHFRTMNGEETYVDFIQKGQTLKREVKQPRRMYSDVAGERANQLTILPNQQALVRLMDNNRLSEYRVNLDRVNRDISPQEQRNREAIVTGIKARSKGRHKRDIIEARIKEKIAEVAPVLGYSDNPPEA
jgi:Type IV secretory system Conjugative DNA transfer